MPRGDRFTVRNIKPGLWSVVDREDKIESKICPTRKVARQLAYNLNRGVIDDGHQADVRESERDHGSAGRD